MARGFNRYGAIASCVIVFLLLHLLAPSARANAQSDDGSEPFPSCYNSLYLPSIQVARDLTASLAPETSAAAIVPAAGLSMAKRGQQIDDESVNPLPGCNLYPIAVSREALTNVPVGGTVTNILNGAGGLHIGWLTWNGENTEATLLANLAPPGNSSTYVNPYNTNDRLLSVGDCIYGLPGAYSSTEVRNALDLLKTVDITAPVWDQYQVSGGRTNYRIVDFALMRITSYPSSTITSISAQFLGYNANCLAPTATPTATPTPTGAATPSPTVGPTPTNTATATPTPTLPGQGGLLDGVAVLGDSFFDEYRGTDNRGGAYAATTFNLIEILQHRRGFNLGPWGARAEPRRTGYEYVWARSGATSFSMISQGQHTGAAAQIAAGDVSFVFIGVGANDFSPLHGSTYRDIYSGVSTDAQVASKVAGAVRNVTLAVDTVLAAGARGVAVTPFTQWDLDPQLATTYPDAAGRKRVADAIDQVNEGIQTMAAARGVLVVDQNAIGQQLLPQLDSGGNLLVGGQKISFIYNGDAPNFARLSDGQHLGTVVSGLMANAYFIDPLNAAFGTGIARLTDVEILAEAGLSAQATPTPASPQR